MDFLCNSLFFLFQTPVVNLWQSLGDLLDYENQTSLFTPPSSSIDACDTMMITVQKEKCEAADRVIFILVIIRRTHYSNLHAMDSYHQQCQQYLVIFNPLWSEMESQPKPCPVNDLSSERGIYLL